MLTEPITEHSFTFFLFKSLQRDLTNVLCSTRYQGTITDEAVCSVVKQTTRNWLHIARTKELALYEGHFVQSRSQLCGYSAGYNDDKLMSVITVIPPVICTALHISHVAVFYANGPRQRMSTQIRRLRVRANCDVLNFCADVQWCKVILCCNTCLFLKSAKKDEKERLTNSRRHYTFSS